MLKKFAALVMILVVLMCLSLKTASASKNNVDAKLRKMGVPEELIQNMMQPLKEDIVKNCIKYITSEEVSLNTTEGKLIPNNGTIPSTDLKLYAQIYEAGESSDGRERYTIFVNYKWLIMPDARQTDPYGVAWDSSKWRDVDNSTYNSHLYHMKEYDIWDGEDDTVVAYANENGVGWNVKMPSKIIYGDDIDAIEGFGRVTIESQTIGSIRGSDNIYMNYSHTYGLAGTIGLAIGPVSVSYSGTKDADSVGTIKCFNY